MYFDMRTYGDLRYMIDARGICAVLPFTQYDAQGGAEMMTSYEDEQAEEHNAIDDMSAHVEEDGVDWCAWWAEYATTLK